MQPDVLQDRFGRRIDYLRISVTDRCDMRCSYCMPQGFSDYEEPQDWLTYAEIERVVAAFARLGTSRFRITGGEPLLRRNLSSLVGRLATVPGAQDISLSTNATQLAKQAAVLKSAGISRLNVSLDSLCAERVFDITRRDALAQVLDGLIEAKRCGFAPIKINMVVMAGVNEDEIDDMAEFCAQHGFVLRLIETMPMGETGRSAGFVDLQPIRQRLQDRFGLVDGIISGGGPARYLVSPDGSFSVGFITPLSQHFCETCNRVRLSVDGTLYLCLGQEHQFPLRPLLRVGISDAELDAAIRSAIELKPQRHEFREQPGKIIRVMSKTGG
ncbi:GTP 3',8-cyclase [Ferriphaselus amnicola]|uniref:GTP 3',8-cyclase n=1 Tax=Ferriphaselus amnicola TaxID=1188319 RepID=A0A2Z6GCR7_9PROT|nr:GTP 3',8-cyclase MoaA [Ferriphaselus amnicola]BBE51423.1 GTP 3',8-cyclase [Ferriphaselus amnicola]